MLPLPLLSKRFVVQFCPRTAKLRDAFLALCSPLPSRRPDRPSKGARLYLLRRLRPTSPRGRRARQRPPPLPQSPLRLSLAAQLPFRFRLPGHVGGGAEQTEAVEGRTWEYASSAAFPLASSTLSGGRWELRRTRVYKFAALTCVEADKENWAGGGYIYEREC